MIPAALRRNIYQSLPRTCGAHPAAISWADTADISRMLARDPIAVTLRISADTVDPAATSPGMLHAINQITIPCICPTLYDITLPSVPRICSTPYIRYTRSQARVATLTISVHACATQTTAAADIIDAYADVLQLWCMRDLWAIAGPVDDAGINDLSYLETDLQRRDLTVYIRYRQGYDTDLPTVSDVDISVLLD